MIRLLRVLLVASLFLPAISQASDRSAERDSDRDGLSDFHERTKYGTDPKCADSDGDGIPDGEREERREFAYTVRSVVQVMKPVTIEYLNDDFQDARVLFEGEDFVELEVVHYPFSTANDAIEAEKHWTRPAKSVKAWLEPGVTSDWTPELRKSILHGLKSDGIDIERLTDKQVVEQVSKWLVERAPHEDGFTSFLTSFDDQGVPFVKPELRERAERELASCGRTLEEQWEREISARGMFEHQTRGSCTSSAIYLSGCLRAVGIPTRTVLCIPLVDANDERERALVETRLEHHAVRRLVSESTQKAIGSWTSHTFNEVWVGGRWRRLNYAELGQGILDAHYLGLMTHVATFHDWFDAHAADTLGSRHGSRTAQELFGGPNPYSTISLSDQFGVHCKLDNPVVDENQVTVAELLWTDGDGLPADIVANCTEAGRFGLIARIDDVVSSLALASFIGVADLKLSLRCEDQRTLNVAFHPACHWFRNDKAYLYIPFGKAERRNLVSGVEYSASARNGREGFGWQFRTGVTR